MSEEVQKQLEVLLNEVRLLSRSVVHLRQDDIRLVFGEQIRPILADRIERSIGPDDAKLKDELAELVDRYVAALQLDGARSALTVLDDYQGKLHRPTDEGMSHHRGAVEELIGQMRDYLVTLERVARQARPIAGKGIGTAASATALSPSSIERTLAPLANARRIDILLQLALSDESLAELSRTLAMKKGHLQFHIKVLMDGGYISYDRKGHLYSITSRGSNALECLSAMVERLSTP